MSNHTVYIIFACMVVFMGCQPAVTHYDAVERPADIHPYYPGTVIPYNIAPLNFAIHEKAGKYQVWFVAGKDSFRITCRKNVEIPLRKWKRLLATHRGEQMTVRIFARQSGGWIKYRDMLFSIAEEPVDPYLAYRLIEPGYTTWGKMGLYQRCLENFDEKPVITNNLLDDACINCHSFQQNNPETMLFHIRKMHPGTLLLKEGQVTRVDTKTPEMLSAGVYPRWHPGGRYVAFSVNTTRQNFHAGHTNKIEVYDMASDIVIYDTESHQVFTTPALSSEASFETFPEWSPDGDYLYYCSAPACPMPAQYDSIRYDLVRIPFDASSAGFGQAVDTLVHASQIHKSVAFARVSPDNRFVIFCLSDFGTFPVWHRENDLYLLHLADGHIRCLTEANSHESDSYHSWSSNGRWLVFGSRRMDGAYTRPYICYFGPDGVAAAPFLLPQENPEYYDFSFKSFNIPEFITGRVKISPSRFSEAARGPAIESSSASK
jgi:hypothetical protein